MSTGEEQCLASPYQFMHKMRAVIIGGGFAALSIAKGLRKSHGFTTTIISPNSHFCFIPDMPITFLSPKKFSKRLISLDFEIDHIQHFHQGFVTNVDFANHEVTYVPTADGYASTPTVEKYDFVIFAHGARYAVPADVKEAYGAADDGPLLVNGYSVDDIGAALTREAVEAAKNVVVVGGGATGCEYAAYIAEKTKDCTVTLLTRGPTILPGEKLSAASTTTAIKALRKTGVQVVANVSNNAPGPSKTLTYTVDGEDTTIPADIVIWGAGTAQTPGIGVEGVEVDRQELPQHLPVDTNLRVELDGSAVPFAFAAGGCATVDGTPEPNLVHTAMDHGRLVVKNVTAIRKQIMGDSSIDVRGKETMLFTDKYPGFKLPGEHTPVKAHQELIYLGKKTMMVQAGTKGGTRGATCGRMWTAVKYNIFNKYWYYDL